MRYITQNNTLGHVLVPFTTRWSTITQIDPLSLRTPWQCYRSMLYRYQVKKFWKGAARGPR